jgi:uncharacterized protein (DUF1810 family)
MNRQLCCASPGFLFYDRSVPSTTPAFNLDRFKEAQEVRGSFDAAMSELRAGRKTTHWIWWVFPQVAGLGTSETSVRYALAGRAEACAYLADDLLRGRLLEAVTAAHEQLLGPGGRPLDRLMGSEIVDELPEARRSERAGSAA